jgi:ankyrin repeat protein
MPRERKLRIDAGVKLNNDSPLGFAAYLSTTEMLKMLINAGANVGHVTDLGSTKLITAVQNAACTIEMLELLNSSNKIDINQTFVPRKRKWSFIYF